MYFSLVVGMSIPELLQVLVFTRESNTPEKALRRYTKTEHDIVLWHYGNVWEEGSEAQKSILNVRKMHKTVREQIQKKNKDLKNCKYITQFDMGVVMSGFMGAIIKYPEVAGITCSRHDLDDYVYFWYGIGHLLGIEKKYNICAHGLSQALAFCQEIEQDIFIKNLKNPAPEFIPMAGAVVTAFQRDRRYCSLLTLPVILALCNEVICGESVKLSFGDTIKFRLWKLLFFIVKNVSWCRKFMNQILVSKYQITFTEI